MRKSKIFIGILLVLCLLVPTSNVFAISSSSYEQQIRNEVINEYKNDPQYIMMKNTNEESAKQYIDMIVQKRLSKSSNIQPQSVSTYGDYAYCYVPVIKQSTTNNCSAATLLQTLYGLGLQGQVSGSDNNQKQATLYNYYYDNPPGARYGSSRDETLYVYEITQYLNSKLISSYYQYRVGSSLSFSSFKSIVWNSLVYNRPVLLHAYTYPLSYYNGTGLYHYLSLDCLTNSTNTVTIEDCNYSSFGGSHYNVSLDQAWRTVHDYSGRYIISY